MSHITDQFVDALFRLEQSKDLEAISSLFDQYASLSNPLVQHKATEDGAARTFWSHYRGSFDTVRTEFRNIVHGDNTSLLEWRSRGQINNAPFSYEGVSVLEIENNKIRAFRAYFDPRRLAVHEQTEAQPNSGSEDRQADAEREAAERRIPDYG